MHMCACVLKSGEDTRSPGGGVIGSCKLPDIGAGS